MTILQLIKLLVKYLIKTNSSSFPFTNAKPPNSLMENPDNFQGKTRVHLFYLWAMTTVALVDDHKIFSDSLAGLINDFEGFSVCWTAQDGAQAIQRMERQGALPDIVLLDIMMPGMSGTEVAKWIFENKKSIKVLALTMEEDDSTVIQCCSMG
jgi:CheY-like chemotaxis protein